MSYSYKTVSIRPNTSVEFYTFTPEIELIIKTKYVDTGKRIFYEDIISDDGLISTKKSVWIDFDAYKLFENELANIWVERDNYNSQNQILRFKEINP